MNRKILNMFSESGSDIDRIMSRSTRAVCGTFERQVSVKNENVSSTKAKLKAKGFIIVGTGPAGQGRSFVWFSPAGVNL